MSADWYLSVDFCEEHDAFSVCLNQGQSGTRLTPAKCCGRSHELERWPLSARQLREIAEEFECAASEAEEAEQ